jgi:8-oxo-dGTP pyrophosphatase MutT (NUDIX family)
MMPVTSVTGDPGSLFLMRAQLRHERTVELDAAWLRRHFATRRPGAPAIAGDQDAAAGDAALTPASVLIPIVLRPAELTVLLTRRTAHLKSHSGQVSFPGGRAEIGDASPVATALRETREEIGLEGGSIEVLGCLGEYRTRTGYRVSPVVALVALPLALRLDPQEVEEAFEVPLSFLLDPVNHQRHTRVFQGREVRFTAMPYGRHYIWGATAAMLVNLYRDLLAGM